MCETRFVICQRHSTEALRPEFTLENSLVSHDPLQNVAVDFVEGFICWREHGILSGLAQFVQQARGRGSSLGIT